jgi:cytochrome c biogenesis protein CcdA/thiol-disulfide isomerase/thioredoxin
MLVVMLLFLLFAFVSGVVTILSPCILPVLPIVLSGSVGGGQRRPLGVVLGFVLSFTFFTLFLSTLVKITGISSDALRVISIVILFGFGVSLLVPQVQVAMEQLFSKLSGVASLQGKHEGFLGGIVVGLSLGLVWTPCVGPIIASVITLAAASKVTLAAVLITVSYSVGTAIPMLAVMYGGRGLLQRVPWLVPNSGKIQKVFGVLMMVTAVGIFFNLDRQFQTYVLQVFPQYGTGLTKIEDNQIVRDQLRKLNPQNQFGQKVTPSFDDLRYPSAPEIVAGGEWFNSKPLTIASLRGKVVLVDFWTYTCINCIRTLPYIKSWYEKYHDKGLVIIGVHTPEFEFEKDAENVRKAIADFGLKYPVVQDNDYATWNAFHNQYWPAKYFIDKDGRIRWTHFGEGQYDESEKFIQTLLAETGASVATMPVHNGDYTIEAETPETYLGYGRLGNFVSNESIVQDKPAVYSLPAQLGQDQFAYAGQWNVGSERAMPSAGASLEFLYKAKDVYLVMRSANKQLGRARVLLDGKVISSDQAGEDVHDGVVTVVDDRLYRLVKHSTAESHVLKLEFLDGNVALYAFTFG